MSNQLRVLVIGARRKRTGLGEFIAREFHQAGARVTSIVGTREETLREAKAILKEKYGIHCQGYTSLKKALFEETLDIVAICTPFPFHESHIEKVASAGLHCLCEKPMWWDPDQPIKERTVELVTPFEKKKRHFQLVTQWPFTLDTFYKLYPREKNEKIRDFQMILSPDAAGEEGVLDMGPHMLSMLEALVGPGEVRGGKITKKEEKSIFHFDYIYPDGLVQCAMELRPGPSSPRPAGYAINGHSVRREVKMPGYQFYLTTPGGQTEALPDPLGQLIRGFLEEVKEGEYLSDYSRIVHHMVNLEHLWALAKE